MAAIRATLRVVALAAALLAAAGTAARAGLVRDAEMEHTLSRLAAPIFAAAGLSSDQVTIYVLQDPRINAFVGTPRSMVLNTGLLRRWDHPEPLIGVIAHEAGHITGGHLARRAIAMRQLSGPAQIGLLVAAAAAAASGSPEAGAALALGGQSALTRSLLAYSRAEEAAADQAGVGYMTRAGVDPNGLLDVLGLFKGQEVFAQSRIDPYAITHPLSSERIGLLERKIAESPAAGRPTDPELRYWHARMQAKLDGFIEDPTRLLARLETAADPSSEPNLMRRAIALHRLGQTDAALAALDRLQAARPNDAYYLDLRGQVLFEAARAGEAAETLRRAARLAPDEPLIRIALGRALLASTAAGSDAEALRVLEAAVRDDPGEPAAFRDLALAYARAGDDARAALATAERLALTGSLAEAEVFARRAMGLLPEGSPGWLRADDIAAMVERARR
jgi:predicted Zn-dependent protease